MIELNKIYEGDCSEVLKTFDDNSIDCCVTSPPYFGLRDYGTATWEGGDIDCTHDFPQGGRNPETSGKQLSNAGTTNHQYRNICPKCNAVRIDSQIGLEETPELYVAKMVEVFTEVKRVLKNEGTLWLNLGDSYNGSNGNRGTACTDENYKRGGHIIDKRPTSNIKGLKGKDLIGIPWMVAFALRQSGWYLRQDIIWCLSGGAYLYARTKKGDMPSMVKDLVRLKPETVKLWNGEKWTQVLGWNRNYKTENNKELVLRSGERIGCTDNHVWPTQRGNIEAKDLLPGDIIKSCTIPEPEFATTPQYLTDDILWLIGLYLAEGSKNGSCLQIAGHIKEEIRLERIGNVATHYGGSMTYDIIGNKLNIRIYGKVIRSIIHYYVSGNNAYDKGLSNATWRLENVSLRIIIEGYLSGDGCKDEGNNRWRLGFCRNYNLERDLRTASARLGACITLTPGIASNQTGKFPSFRGEWRWERSGHFNEKDRSEVIEIRNSRARKFWDIGVEDEPHLFSLASGVLTHNSKPNPMPESVTDRCTKAHEYIFLLSKSSKYYYDADAIKEPFAEGCVERYKREKEKGMDKVIKSIRYNNHDGILRNDKETAGVQFGAKDYFSGIGANKRSVWTVTTRAYSDAHFATFPERLITDMIKAGCPENGIILDPFMGAGTTGLVARKLNRNFVGIELNPVYIKIANKRLEKELGMFI